MKIIRTIRERDWDRVVFYTQRVRFIRMEWAPDLISADDAQRLLGYALSREQNPLEKVLFPNLLSLEANIRNLADSCLLSMFTGPRLAHINFTCSLFLTRDYRFITSFFDRLDPTALERLQILFYGNTLDLPHLLRPFVNLEDLSIRGPDFNPSDLVLALAGAKCLRKISLRPYGPGQGSQESTAISWPEDLFIGLQEADVNSVSLPAVLSPSFIPFQLCTLWFHAHLLQEDIHKAVRDSIRLIGATCFRLQRLKIAASPKTDYRFGPTPPNPAPLAHINVSISPLLRLHELEELSFYDSTGSMSPDWHEEGLPLFEASWPRLTTLSWQCLGVVPSGDLSVLSRFTLCSELRSLVLPLDATVIVPSDALTPFWRTVCFGVGGWTIDAQSVERIAQAIITLHPSRLGRLQLFGQKKSEDGRLWEAVQKKIREAFPVRGRYW